MQIQFTTNLNIGSWPIWPIFTHKHGSPPCLTKSRRKCVILCPVSMLLTKIQLSFVQLFLATCNVCPLAIPESFAHKVVSDYWQIIHYDVQLLVAWQRTKGQGKGLFGTNAWDSLCPFSCSLRRC